MILPRKRMAGQDASSCATEILCSRHLLNAKRYLQADRKPSAPRPACPRETCLQQPTSSAVSTVPYKLCKASPWPGDLSVSPEKRLTLRQACLPRLVSLPQRVLVSSRYTPSTRRYLPLQTVCWKHISESSCHCNAFAEQAAVHGCCSQHL